MKYDYLIVGAGLFGATIANLAKKDGKKVLVIEKRNHIAGNIYTEEINNIQVHKYGAHIFRTNNKTRWNYLNKFGEFNNFINSPIAIYKKQLYNLPFNMNTFSKIWKDVFTPEDALRHIKKEKQEIKKKPKNLEEQAISLVGRTIYKKLIKGYTEKQWGKKCKDLPPEILKRIPVRFTYNNNYFNDIYQGIPKEGYTKLIGNMLKGIKVKLNCNYLENQEKYNKIANKIIYTGAIDEYYNYCYGELEYRSLKFENEILDIENYQGNAVVNYTEYKIPYTRIIEHKHFNNKDIKGTIITKEYPQQWDKDKEPYYPINDENNNKLYNKYKKLSKKDVKVIFGGRLGLYQYIDMDETIEKAMKLYNKIRSE